MELQQMEGGSSSEIRTKWLLNSPNPPPAWQQQIKHKLVLPPPKHLLQALFPILKWGGNYKASKFKNDLMAGLTLASLCIPQSIGYASLARLDPQYGLYTSVVPPLIYALMGSSREMAIGPVAVVSLLLSAMISKLVDPADPLAYRRLVFTGTFQALFGLFRLGFLIL